MDDFSASGVDSCPSTFDKLWLGGVDEVAATVKAMMVLTSTAFEEGASIRTAGSLVGRTLDLQSAYRQLPTCHGPDGRL